MQADHNGQVSDQGKQQQLGKPRAGCSAAFGHSVAVHPEPAQKTEIGEGTSIYRSVTNARPLLGLVTKLTSDCVQQEWKSPVQSQLGAP